MDISVGGQIIARISPTSQYIQRLLGAYELVFQFEITLLPAEGKIHELTITGADVAVRSTSGEYRLGLARLYEPLIAKQTARSPQFQVNFVLHLLPHQIGAIEEVRSNLALSFILTPIGRSGDESYASPIHNPWPIDVPQSRWLGMLREARVLDVVLIEIPMPLIDVPEQWKKIVGDLIEAQRHFHRGEYTAVVISCRKVVQELGQMLYSDQDWSGPALDRLNCDRRNMTKEQREAAITATIRHLTHLAAHADGEGGAVYTRNEARQVLALTAAVVARNTEP